MRKEKRIKERRTISYSDQVFQFFTELMDEGFDEDVTLLRSRCQRLSIDAEKQYHLEDFRGEVVISTIIVSGHESDTLQYPEGYLIRYLYLEDKVGVLWVMKTDDVEYLIEDEEIEALL